jgi:hypothetical protein
METYTNQASWPPHELRTHCQHTYVTDGLQCELLLWLDTLNGTPGLATSTNCTTAFNCTTACNSPSVVADKQAGCQGGYPPAWSNRWCGFVVTVVVRTKSPLMLGMCRKGPLCTLKP